MLTFVLCATLSAGPLQARQSAAPGGIAGTVVDGASGAPLPGVVVAIEGIARETVTAADGTFAFANVPPARHTLFVSLVGYALARPVLDVAADRIATIVVPLAGGTAAYKETVTVVSDPIRGPASSAPAAMVLDSADLLDLRGVLLDDPLRAVQALPSAATGDDFRSEFSVRGSSFSHIGLTVDGIPIEWPVHAVRDREGEGSLSLINGSVLESAVLLTGTHAQDRPGRTGAWVDLVIREGSRAGRRVQGSVSASAASVVVEGPLGAGRGSWLVSARQSYLQWLLDRLDDDGGTAFGFTDLQGKVVWDAGERHQLQMTLIGGRAALHDEQDTPDQNSVSSARARTGLAIFGWRTTIAPELVLTQRLAAGGNDFTTDATLGAVLAEGSGSRVAYRTTMDWTPRAPWLLQLGGYAGRERAGEHFARFQQGRGTLPPLTEHVIGAATFGAVHARAVWTRGIASVDTGILVQPATFAAGGPWSPWMLGRVQLPRRLSVRAGFGVHQQVPRIEHVLGTFAGAGLEPERARQLEVALEQPVGGGLRWQITAYDRREDGMLRLEGSEAHLDGGRVVRPSADSFWRNALEGGSRGIEVVLQRRAPTGLTGWVGYGYGRTRYTDSLYAETFSGDYDQRYTFSAYAHQRLSPTTSVSAKLRAGSNVPLPGYFETRNDELWLSATRNTVRLPRYARIDVRASHAFNFDRKRLTLFAEIINLTGRENVAADTPRIAASGRVTRATRTLFPFLPSAGLMVEF